LTLAEYVTERGPLPADLGAALGVGLTEALKEIHQADILHRDLKPSNILLGADGPRVIDFGLAALTEAPSDLTRTSEIIGTPVCMAPEQAHASKELTEAVDVYSLGAVLLFAMTGHYPYQRPTASAMLFAITDLATPPDLSGLPDILVKAVGDMLAKAPTGRPTLNEVAAAIAEVLADGGLTDPGTASQWLAGLTYVERDDDPTPPAPPRARPPRLPENPRVPSALVQQIADTLRRDYDRDAGF
ncbi:MAG: serine/threonine-protein kinase, partial [Trebonia sp.]